MILVGFYVILLVFPDISFSGERSLCLLDLSRGTAYLCINMNVSTADHSGLECSSRPCKDCTLKRIEGRGAHIR